MLIMTMRKGDYVVIGEDITIHYDDSNGAQLSIGIDAPKSIPVLRGKVYEELVTQYAEAGMEEADELFKKLGRIHETREHRSKVRQTKKRNKKLENAVNV